MLHELERRQWIERRVLSGDGRSHSLFMTAAGKEAMVRIESLAAQHERQMVKFIGRDLRHLLLDDCRSSASGNKALSEKWDPVFRKIMRKQSLLAAADLTPLPSAPR